VSAGHPLGSGQTGIWFDQMLRPDSPLYNMGGYLRIDGPVDTAAFEAALGVLVARNDALRITLRGAEDDLPLQEVQDGIAWKLPLLELRDDAAAENWMRERMNVPLPLLDAPLFEFALLKVADDRWYWFHKYHHVIIDAYAHSLLVGQLARVYTGLMRGTAGEWSAPSYLDYLADDAGYARSKRHDDDAAYWREKFSTLPEPAIERRSPGDPLRNARAVLTLPRALYDRMIAVAAEHGGSPLHLILASLYVYFTRTGRRDELAIGLPTLNRGTAAFKNTVGCFTGVTPAWFRLGRELTAAELLREVARALRRDYRHVRLPLSEINALSGLHREGRAQIHDIHVTYENQSYDVTLDGHPVEQISLRHGAEQTPLAFEITEFSGRRDVRVNIDYSTTAFSGEEIEAFQERWAHLLEAIVEEPDLPMMELPLMTPRERRRALFGFEGETLAFPPELTLVELFEAQARRTPAAVALLQDGRQMSYEALDAFSNQIAAYLRAHGAGPGALVGVCMERSFELIAAVLGILKSGAAYVPVDPASPAERIGHILTDAGVKLVVTASTAFPESLRNTEAVPVLFDQELNAILSESAGPVPVCATPDAPAYVIYTSGSTGKPKGTLVSHHNVVRLFRATQRSYRFGTDTWALFHSIAFDVSVWEIFGALLHGGRLAIVPYWVSRTPDELWRLIYRYDVTVLCQTPSAFYPFMRAEPAGAPRLPLRWIIFAGEALDFAALRPWMSRHRTPALVNMYGITETTVHSTFRLVQEADVLRGRSVIGRPLCDLHLYLLDERMQPVPIGVPGELYVGGDGVAIGYLNRPELDAARFLRDPFRDGGRVYRSGDLARRLPDGDLEYLGRIDDQVKIRGFRVELDEIRIALESQDAVAECAVIALRGDDAAEDRLVAYIRTRGERPPVTELRAFLRRKLPDYMVPAAFVFLDALPLTVNGKLDKRALPPPAADRPALAQSYVAPRHDIEKKIAGIWKDVLRVEQVGLYDNFFDLGGQSLLMMRVRARLRTQLDASLSMAQMFAYPTVDALACLVAGREGVASAEEPGGGRRAGGGRVSQAQQRARRRGRAGREDAT
jgi:amino acid adenylation domain-containing protein